MVKLQLISNLPETADAKVQEFGAPALISLVQSLRTAGIAIEGITIELVIQKNCNQLRVVQEAQT